MANAEGGVIAIGLFRGVCEGIKSHPESQNDWRQAGLDFTVPAVRYDFHRLDCINRHGEPDELFRIGDGAG